MMNDTNNNYDDNKKNKKSYKLFQLSMICVKDN